MDGKTYEETLAERIEKGVEECECRGSTRESISEKMGFQSTSSLSRWVNGSVTPGPENLQKLANATGLSLDWIVAGRGPMFAPTETDAVRLQVIGKVADGTISADTVNLLANAEPSDSEEKKEEGGQAGRAAGSAQPGEPGAGRPGRKRKDGKNGE